MAEETHTFVAGRGQRNALLLLTAAAELKEPKFVVEAIDGGYRVPVNVAERYEELKATLEKDEAARAKKTASASADTEEPAEKPARKTTRKTAARKTAAKKTASAAQPKE